jgi:hypothetical protein
MRAMVYTEYGPPDVLKLKEIEKPTGDDTNTTLRVCYWCMRQSMMTR